jgi:hypothetical protein
MDDHSSYDAAPDAELGAALRDALAMPWGAAFVTRVRARLAQQRQRTWDEELAGWLWQGLVAASLLVALAGWSLNLISPSDDAQADGTPTTVAGQLLEGATPGVNVLIASLSPADAP